ncbi:MAG: noncanonical pyrimidine nucleotidase, YjjG family [Ruminococcaceae bacterium]|nr:noncanonical pyrimidine nucleotidase, YjjG family [Oscillospiraceae bacterium]
MNKYTTLLFDLDNTLLDFYKSEYLCIKELFKINGLPFDDEAVNLYSEINDGYWKKYERGEIKAEGIYENRFIDFLNEIGVQYDSKKLLHGYPKLLSKSAVKMPYCDEILLYCKNKGYDMAVITNGLAFNQHSRIKISGIKDYISNTFISEELGAQKPEKAFFDRVLEKTKEKDKSKILVIGDSVTSDIKGAFNAGIDSCFIGDKDCEATYKIKQLKELKNII